MAGERRLRVCIALGPYPPEFSGHGIQMRRTLPLLRARGIDPTILANRLPPGFSGSAADDGSVLRVLTPGTGVVPRLLRIVQFRRCFRRGRAGSDVLHSALQGWEFLLNIPHLKRLGLPILFEMVLLGGDDPLTTSRERFGARKIDLLRQVDSWVGIAGAFRSTLPAVGIDATRFRLIHTGVDIQQYRPLDPAERRDRRRSMGIPETARVVVTVGSVIARKGIDRVLRAWRCLEPVQGRDLLLVVGPAVAAEGLRGDELDFARRMRSQCEDPVMRGTARLVGRSDRVEDYLGVADLFLFLSRREGLGTVILESLACALPCVVSPLDGIAREVIDEDRTGHVLQDPDDARQVAGLLARLLADPARRAAMGREARHEAVRRFSLDARADALAALYRELAAHAGPRGGP